MKKRYAIPAMGMMLGVGLLVGLKFSITPALPAALSAPPERIDVSRPSAILEVRSLGQLVSRSVEMEKIVESGTWGGNALQRAWYKDHMLFIANGIVLIGFDLAALPESSVVETNSTVTVNLGSPKILFSKIDNTKSRVYERDVGLFNSQDDHLESKTRAEAEAALVATACKNGDLQKGAQDGQRVVKNLLERVFKAAKFNKEVQVLYTMGRC
jgi:Protein of unknown function (DUF4230)